MFSTIFNDLLLKSVSCGGSNYKITIMKKLLSTSLFDRKNNLKFGYLTLRIWDFFLKQMTKEKKIH